MKIIHFGAFETSENQKFSSSVVNVFIPKLVKIIHFGAF